MKYKLKEFSIEGRKIGRKRPIFLIAEAGVNHNGKISLAKKMVDIASNAEVDAIKFQTYFVEELILEKTPKVEYQKTNKDDNENFYDLLKSLALTSDEFLELKNYCNKKGLVFLSTPFDFKSLDLLDKLNVSAYKIGSGDMNNFPLIEKICSKEKPILVSTGMATMKEVRELVSFIEEHHNYEFILLQCTSNYPTPIRDINLNVIDTYKSEFPDIIIGFSDHSLGLVASLGAAAKGVKVIEKHFTLDKNMEGPDHKASLDPSELKDWVQCIRKLEDALGKSEKKPSEKELEVAKVARKSIVSLRKIPKGKSISRDDVSIKRPGYGISPKHYEEIIKKRAKNDIPENSILRWKDLE